MAKGTMSLEALEKLLANPDQVLDLVARSLAEESIGLIKDGFRAERDPYGSRWQPKQARDGRKTLSGKTSRLKTGWKVTRSSTSEIVVSPSVDYAVYHQSSEPRKRLPRRMMIPDDALGMPAKWEQQLNEAATDAFAAVFGGDGRRVSALRKMLGTSSLVGFKVGT